MFMLVGAPLSVATLPGFPRSSAARPCREGLASGARRSRALKLDPAFFRDRSLLDRDHLALHLGELSCRLLVATDEKSRRPEDDDCGGRRPGIFCALGVLCAGGRGQ